MLKKIQVTKTTMRLFHFSDSTDSKDRRILLVEAMGLESQAVGASFSQYGDYIRNEQSLYTVILEIEAS
jgi:hypothetical protein